MTEPHVCNRDKRRRCAHRHTRAIDPKVCGPAAPCICMCCGRGLLVWNPWEKR